MKLKVDVKKKEYIKEETTTIINKELLKKVFIDELEKAKREFLTEKEEIVLLAKAVELKEIESKRKLTVEELDKKAEILLIYKNLQHLNEKAEEYLLISERPNFTEFATSLDFITEVEINYTESVIEKLKDRVKRIYLLWRLKR